MSRSSSAAVETLFPQEISHTIAAIETLLAMPRTPDFSVALRTQVAALLSWGKILEMTEFVTLAEATVQLMRACPTEISTIAQLSLVGFKALYRLESDLLAVSEEHLILPQWRAVDQAREVIHSQSSSEGTGPWVLVVDDSQVLREMMTLTLMTAQYRVQQAQDGLDALQRLAQYPQIQIVISDIEMPHMNGLEFVRHCRQHPQWSQLPIILLSAYGMQSYQELAVELGANAYFVKPYEEEKLLACLHHLLSMQTNV